MPKSRPTSEDQRVSRANRRAKARRSFRPPVSFVTLRMAELYRVFNRRYGHAPLPDDDAGRDDMKLVFEVLSNASSAAEKMAAVAVTWAPWMPGPELSSLIQHVVDNPRRFKADTIAKRLGVTAAERAELGLRTIGAIDFPAKQRQEHRREMQRLAKEQKRRASGSRGRAQFEGQSAERQRPWEPLGISRRTWYRRCA
ncbi:hypothetical protein JQ609_19950 [Bradyrhizobium sp. AUGA SZCCT0169]|uniref:hypothetical protein n=1 Tax=Bradyrhizobium sp. AUGA SZCCT0169 TaxID=2807663 RepID=UPI001BADE8C3|nr:hypothetical protein [Bradyrhizobium sp. AUGA SZCCT0169]MBR1249188.1 hypothetical protein [Bradyrhizobium sp. AUGA SZCCT0169]